MTKKYNVSDQEWEEAYKNIKKHSNDAKKGHSYTNGSVWGPTQIRNTKNTVWKQEPAANTATTKNKILNICSYTAQRL